MNLLDGRVGKGQLEFAEGFTLPIPREFANIAEGRKVILGFRADNMMPERHALEMDEPSPPIEMPVVVSEPLGTETLLYTRLAGQEVQAKMLKPRPVADGESLTFHLDLARCHLFDAGTKQSLR
jgi:multiple sugar transport system ATP-binding protein